MKSPFPVIPAPLLVALLLSGCAAVGPNYATPELAAPVTWRGAAAAEVVVAPTVPKDLATWWRQLDDPTLIGLIEQALQGSLDLRASQAKLREARARRALAGAELFPTVSGSADGRRVKASSETGGGGTANRFSAGFDASWELDVFGGLRRGVEAAQANLEASQASLYDVQVSLVAEVGLNYTELRASQAALAIAKANAASQTETLQLTQWRAQAGLTTTLDVEQARANLEQTKAQIPSLETSRAEAEQRLAILLGQQPGTLAQRLTQPGGIPRIPARVTVGIPADALRQRPDVQVAERTLAAETARIGVVEAQAYPSFSLSGSLSLEALTVGALSSGNAVAGSVLGSVAAPIFDAGRIRQQVNIQTAVQEQALINYEATVLNALGEVENALAALANTLQRQDNLREALQAARLAARLARDRYSTGLSDFQTVLDTERTVLTVEDKLTLSEADGVKTLIQLYKALGGGWSPTPANPIATVAAGTSP
ncbi:MAG TPA: efflux transporter outer membrane subunit [Candidatus Contendobacter sp.]|nr:efflux transporter outer membrane subunit [Candidatus Competibacteraceae bacterium]HRZ53476.1 efflux transporter outer membrane subunit [Candidatus Contendobacter sp.]